ncbi:TPA: HNH endonuclease [Stenotrophomonas maltophilia]|uniref:HNH endonuclease n=1 Tax=Stenotrophomonas maltophilia TaxID=40324 RepID=UPI002A945AD8|nr:HNH endonuclease [Stenotrophomonas maltophilia]HEL3762722.1 HNH endonuclease [Stenotrophomonas maltophilia]HEL5338859.1 HNH endonuclease [Stenotrophomonas maltophilia]
MNLKVDVSSLCTEVQSRLGIEIELDVATLDGCEYHALRPRDLERGHGFFVAIAQTPKQILASVHFDAYAGRLFRLMADADNESKESMRRLVSAAPLAGMTAYCMIDDIPMPADCFNHATWKSLDIEVSSRIGRSVQDDGLLHIAAGTASYAFAIPLCLVKIEEVESPLVPSGQPEGAAQLIEAKRYERSPANRAACLAFHGTTCKCCGFDFYSVYGDIGTGFIEVHHTLPVSLMGEGYIVDPIRDLVPLCSNCHSMAHRANPPLTIEYLRERIRGSRGHA